VFSNSWFVGIAGSVIGALIFAAIERGVGFTAKSWTGRREALELARQEWEDATDAEKTRITEIYLFRVLSAMFVANAAWVLPEFATAGASAGDIAQALGRPAWFTTYAFSFVSYATAAVFFLYGFATIGRYLRIRRS
jgi:hypothetical protein